MHIKAETPMLYVLGKAGGGDDVDDADVLYIPPSTVDLDISADLRDLLILTVSGQHVCKEDCLGLCPTCGVNLNLETCKCKQLVP
jgi:uncharacterized protein